MGNDTVCRIQKIKVVMAAVCICGMYAFFFLFLFPSQARDHGAHLNPSSQVPLDQQHSHLFPKRQLPLVVSSVSKTTIPKIKWGLDDPWKVFKFEVVTGHGLASFAESREYKEGGCSPSNACVQIAELVFQNGGTVFNLTKHGCLAQSPGGQSPDGNDAQLAIDGDRSTKWLDFNIAPMQISCDEGIPATEFTLVTANDAPEYDPIQWALYAATSNPPREWTKVHLQSVTTQERGAQLPCFPKLSKATTSGPAEGSTASAMQPVGQGYCSSGYYAGSDGKGLKSQDNCNAVCEAEAKCNFAAWKKGWSCNLYNGQTCVLNGKGDHFTYSKTQPDGIGKPCDSQGVTDFARPPPPPPPSQVWNCKCGTAVGKFVELGRGNTCELACASTWARNFSSHSKLSNMLANEPSIIADGVAYTSVRSMALCTVMRDGESLIPNLRTAAEKLATIFKTLEVIIIENDSRPALRRALEDWNMETMANKGERGKVSGIHVNSYKLKAPKTNRDDDDGGLNAGSRFHMLGLLRNECLNEIAHRSSTGEKIDVFGMIDLDDDLNIQDVDLNGVAHTFGLKTIDEMSWDAACTNGVTSRDPVTSPHFNAMKSYDSFALHKRTLARGQLAVKGPSGINGGVKVTACLFPTPCSPVKNNCQKARREERVLPHCLMWHHTDGCSANGTRNPSKDMKCAMPGELPIAGVVGTSAGYCACSDGSTVQLSCDPKRRIKYCEYACAQPKLSSSQIVQTCLKDVYLAFSQCGSGPVRYYIEESVPPSFIRSCKDLQLQGHANTYKHSFHLQMEQDIIYVKTCIEDPENPNHPIVQTHRIVRNCNPPPTSQSLTLQWGFRDSMAFRNVDFTLDSYREHEYVAHLPHDLPIKVESCFGGLAVYDLTTPRRPPAGKPSRGYWRDCFFAAHDDNDCEHVTFHNCLTKHLGWKMILNPRMWLLYEEPVEPEPQSRFPFPFASWFGM